MANARPSPSPPATRGTRSTAPDRGGGGPATPPRITRDRGGLSGELGGRAERERAREAGSQPQPARPLVTWDELRALVARHQRCFRTPPRSCRASLGTLICEMLLAQEDGDSPAAPDFLLTLPKLLWPAEPGLNGKRHEKNVQRRLAWAHQGRWGELMREALARPASQLPAQEPADALAEGGLSPETARRLYRAAVAGQLGKAWKQLRAPPPQTITEEVWRTASEKLRPHGDPAPELPHNAFIHRWAACLSSSRARRMDS